MDVSHYVAESAAFTRATLAGKWSRWLAFIVLGLPWMVLLTLVDSWKIIDGTGIHWRLIPWQEAGLLVLLGLLCNFVLSGYIVRLLRGDPTPPDFDHWLLLCRDGIKFHIIPLVWIFVPLLLAYFEYNITSSELRSGSQIGLTFGWVLILVLILIQLIIIFIAAQYAIVGAIRFARTGSVREAFVVLSIRETLSNIGIINYFIGLGVITAVWLVSNFILHQISLIPYAGPLLSLGLSPVLTVFSIRYIAHSCDEALPPAKRGEAEVPPVPVRTVIVDGFVWLIILAVLFVLCVTPMALVAGSVTGLLR
jgi:hypothetical protein